MHQPTRRSESVSDHRRGFLKTAGAATAALAAVPGLNIARAAHTAGSDVLRVGLVGCGGRGAGAAANALNADPNCHIVALADAFPDRLQGTLDNLKKRDPARVTVDAAHCFVGLDCCERLLASGVDVVLLAEPPHFRPRNLKAAIAAGKHVFCEKPVAVDPAGIRSVLETTEQAKQKNLNIVSGLCWRYDHGVRETMKRVLDGAIGDLVSMRLTYNTGELWHRGRQPDWTEMQYQVRNWYYFTWLSGDFNCEQHVHTLDKALWAMHDTPPTRAWGLGGRQVRTDPKYGNIFDHHAVVYEYEGGPMVHSYCRQMGRCWGENAAIFLGTKGRANILRHLIEGENPWKFPGPKPPSMYDVEHQELFAAIRSGKPINNGIYMAYSTMLAVLGRMTTYTGQLITWEQAMASKEELVPSAYTWDAKPPIVPDADGRYPIAIPGVTPVV
jgi:predicted dehydrogenase